MKLEKKHWMMLIAGVVILFLVYWFFFRKKKTESSYDAALPLIGGTESGYRTALSGPVTRKTLTTVVPDSWVWGGYKRQCPKGMAIYNGGPNDGWCAPLSN